MHFQQRLSPSVKLYRKTKGKEAANMKRLTCLALAVFLMAGLAVSGAWAYTFPNNTLVESYNGHKPYNWNGYWHDVIGETSIYETYGADLAGKTLTIYTNWGGAGFTDHGAVTADLFIDTNLNGTWDAAIRLDGANQGKIYYNPAFKTSEDFFASQTSLVYGGRYDPSAPKPVPAQATSNPDPTDTSLVTWTHLTGNPNWSIAINLTNVNDFDPNRFAFIWATGTCANDTAEGHVGIFGSQVPLPSTLLLLGSGLVGLACLGGRKFRKKIN
jgi:hypothetical protein